MRINVVGWLMVIFCGACTTEKDTSFFGTPQPDQEPSVEEDDSAEPVSTTEGTVRFVVLGDAGMGNQAQYNVAAAIKNVCAQRGCDFALYLGDNFYDSGVDSIEDPQFTAKFEDPYAELNFPFYAVLGNHDYGLTNVWDRPNPQIAYTDVSEKWIMPDRYHSHSIEHALFVGIDSNAIMWNDLWEGMEAQSAWVNETISSSGAHWKFAYGHHPYVSNGSHGIAGQYDGFAGDVIVSGKDVKHFVEDQLCGKVDVYFSGHDHDLQWLEPSCGVEFIVSGAGSKSRETGNWGAGTRFEAYGTHGFLWVEIVDSQLQGVFYDSNEAVLYDSIIYK